ncbi:hypothetical protein [Streptomyces sp. NPDC088180]|uniref:hypothetical protein n=1 Tax=Streptomyces sp. NPDC088180 TaxID=3365837 RepID=UPI003812F64F
MSGTVRRPRRLRTCPPRRAEGPRPLRHHRTPTLWLRFLDAAEIAGLAAIAHRATGRLPDAEKATAQALHLLGPSMHRNRAYYGIQLAELQLAQGDTTSARATAAVDTTAVSSPRIAQRLATVHHQLATA